jgi:hypothetical protein
MGDSENASPAVATCLPFTPAAFAALSGRAATFLVGVAFGLTDLVAFTASGLDVCFEVFFGLRAAFMQEVTLRLVVEWSLYPSLP